MWLRNIPRIINVLYLLIIAPNIAAFNEELQAPTFLTELVSKETLVSEGQTKILECTAFGTPQPVYQWERNGIPLGDFHREYFQRVTAATRDDGGVYRCLAKNDAGTVITTAIQVKVSYLDGPVNLEPLVVTVEEGSVAVIPLEKISSYPKPTVTWSGESEQSLIEGDRIAISEPNNSLVILGVRRQDEGIYRAMVTNTQLGREIQARPVRLLVDQQVSSRLGLEIIVPPSNVTVIRGKSLTRLHCIAFSRSLSDVEILWYKDDIPIREARIRSFTEYGNRSLTLLQATIDYAGRYKCIARLRSTGEQKQAVAYVDVQAPPSLTNTLPRQTKGDLGNTLIMECNVEAIPSAQVRWLKNAEDIEVLADLRYRVLSNGSLVVSSLKPTDSGVYQCLASNPVGEVATYTWLTVKTSAPRLLEPPTNQTVLDGHEAVLTCRAEGAPHPNITWIFNGTEIIASGRYDIEADGALRVSNVGIDDSGQYECRRANSAGIVNGHAYISILVKTKISEPPQDTQVILGHVASMPCGTSHASSVRVIIQWTRNGRVVSDIPSGGRISVANDGTLQIQEVRATDAGTYTCQVHSSGGNDSRSASLLIIELPYAPVDVKAERINDPKPNPVDRALHQPKVVQVSWNAPFDGNDPIRRFEVEYREVPRTGPSEADLGLNWIMYQSNVTGRTSVLVRGLKASTAYQFRVSAVNGVGQGPPSEPSPVILLPQEAPSKPPQGLVGSPRSSSEIMIQWEAPPDDSWNGVLLGYLVRYRLWGYKDARWYYRNITNSNQLNYLIGGLITWKSYEIETAAYNARGAGVFSSPLIVKTKEGVPQGSPRKVEAAAIQSDVVFVTWTAPEPSLINGINQGYKVQAWKNAPEESKELPVTVKVTPSPYPNARQSVNMTNLEKFTHYWITVLCFTAPGDGPRSEPIQVTTLEDVPDQVTAVNFSEVTDRALRLSWKAPQHQNGILKGYTVSYRPIDNRIIAETLNLTADVTNINLTNLTAYTNYSVEIVAWTSKGAGTPLVTNVRTAVEPVLPDPPTRLAVSNIQRSSVVLQFTPGFDGNARIKKYTVEVKTGRSSKWTTLEVLPAMLDATSLTVVDLTPYTEYMLRLKAHNAAGGSIPSPPSPSFQTLHADPAHGPNDVRVRAVSAAELRVRWVPLQPNEWHGVPRGYRVVYRPTDCMCTAQSAFVEDVTANSYTINNLEEFTQYDVTVEAVNDVGSSNPQDPPVQEKTRESVPSAGPSNVEAEATSSTTIVVRWGHIPEKERNGILRGFKVAYGGRGVSTRVKVIEDNTTQSTTLTELRKYFNYSIQVQAFTRSGDGAFSLPQVITQTMEDVPGPPSNVSFPDVSFTYARIIWSQPKEPNGEIIAYSVTYHLLNEGRRINITNQLGPDDRTFKAVDLESQSNYVFILRAKGRLGWGAERRVLVYTTAHRSPPTRPTRPAIGTSQITATTTSFTWTMEDDSYAPIRYYEVEKREGDNNNPWIPLPVHSSLNPPLLSSYTASDLRPATLYSFRIRAANDVGLSEWSLPSLSARTLSTAPEMGPTNVKIVPITRNSVRVTWTPLDDSAWNGDKDTAGYAFSYRDSSGSHFPAITKKAMGANADTIVLEDLKRNTNYEITVWAFNARGISPHSSPHAVYVGEAVPVGTPLNVKAEPLSAIEVMVRWQAPPKDSLNGELLGYKVMYIKTSLKTRKTTEEIEIVGPDATQHVISYLDPYTMYSVTLLCFNPAGEGPVSTAVLARTLEAAPGPVENLHFEDITMTSLKVIWDPPHKPNGEITGYLVTYETAQPDENFSKQVKQKVSSSQLVIESLNEEVTYKFRVRAETIALGPVVSATVTTGPQKGSPSRPKDVRLSQTVSSVTVHWRNNHPGDSPINGYYIQSKKRANEEWEDYSDQWTNVMRTSAGPSEEYSIAFQNLRPATRYEFRVSSYNDHGISHPAVAEQTIITPNKVVLELGSLHQQPFYHQTWFVVTLAAGSIVVIIAIIATLCVKSSAYKYKNEAANKTMDSTLTLNEPAYEMRTVHRPSALSTLEQTSGCLGPMGSSAGILSARTPPRPAPASVTYSDDDTTVKGYDDQEDSSDVSEKPTDMSSTDSQESDVEPGATAAPSFVNHYANVNESLRSSWQRQKPFRNYSSYTDSEAEGSAVMSLNGGQVVLNNMAGSRAPLPGFSSFV